MAGYWDVNSDGTPVYVDNTPAAKASTAATSASTTPDFANMSSLGIAAPTYGGASIALTPENMAQMLEASDPSIKAARDKATQDALAQEILKSSNTAQWTGQGFGSAQANAADMARILAGAGLTDISQFGQRAQTQSMPVTTQDYVTRATDDGSTSRILASSAGIVRDPSGNLATPTYDYDGNIIAYTPLDANTASQVTSTQGYQTSDTGDGSSFIALTPEQITAVKNGSLSLPTGQQEYINKATGQVINPSYDRAGGNIWSGTFAGQGSTGYGAQFDAQGNPMFYTQFGGSTNDLANMLSNPVINLVANAAAAMTGGPIAVAALNGANTIANGGSVGDALKSAVKAAALTYAGGQVAEGVTGQLGTAAQYGTDLGSSQTAMLAAQDAGMGVANNITAKVIGNAAGQVVGSGGKIDPVQALLSGGFGAGTNAVLSDLPGYSSLDPNTQAAIAKVVTKTLQTGNLAPADLIGAAMSAGKSAMANSTNTPTADQTAANNQSFIDSLAPYDSTPATQFTTLADYGITPAETNATDWASLYATPTTNPLTGETIIGGNPADFANQNLNISQDNIDSFNQSLQGIIDKGGFTSQWQTVGGDRIMVQDDGTAIGINENGDSYSLTPDEVTTMIDNGQLNTAESGYVAATGGTGNTPGGSGTNTTAKTAATVKTPATTAKTAATTTTPTTASLAAALGLPLYDVAHIKSFKELFGHELDAQDTSNAQDLQTAEAALESGKPSEAEEALAALGQENYFSGGHVDDFNVDSLLQILRS